MRRPLHNWIALLAVTAIVLYLCWQMIEPFVTVVLWATVLAIISRPYYLRQRQRGRGPAAAAGITTLLVVLVVVIPVSLIGLALVRQAGPAAEAVQSGIRTLLDPNSKLFMFLDRYLDMEQLRDPEFLTSRLRGVTGAVASRTLGLVGGLLGAILQIFFVLFALYYLLRDADSIMPALRDSLPLEEAETDEVFQRTRDVINASLYGVLVIAAIQGALGGLAFWALGLPSPLLWGVVMFLFSMIPLAGSFVVWVPAAIYLAVTGQWTKAILLTFWGGVVIGMVDNFLRPRIVGGRAKLHELVIFFAVLGGLHVFGVLGLVIGPVVVAIAISLLDVLRRAQRDRVETAPIVVAPKASIVVATESPAATRPSDAPSIESKENPA